MVRGMKGGSCCVACVTHVARLLLRGMRYERGPPLVARLPRLTSLAAAGASVCARADLLREVAAHPA